ncbi:Fic/DOC family protein [Janthinobacterium sp. 35]|uniref:Fic family protein n=1 Tax=Janthinobacterium sp. 35 TaxID=2035210 RepID=UPI000C193E79|nr:Fic family protein [Janthinobacterium sp. 35]PIG29381.1 Fic/DOC family protein [Janthinobacterium sp. 35]
MAAKLPSWEYEEHPHGHKVEERCSALLVSMHKDISKFERFGVRTLRGHRYVFRGVTPKDYHYFAGNYRGTRHALREYNVVAGGDKRTGFPALVVPFYMETFDALLTEALKKFDDRMAQGLEPLEDFLVVYVSILADFLVWFLGIHPYVNGNGHMSRLLIWALLGKIGAWPVSWSVHARPNYVDAIVEYRNGNKDPLEEFILKSIIA